MLAVDHGYFQGPTTGLENPRKTISPLLPFAIALIVLIATSRSTMRRFPLPAD